MTGLLRRILTRLRRSTSSCVRVTFADGSTYQNRDGEPLVQFHFKTAGAQWNTICFGHIGMLESYFAQTLEIEGDLSQAFAVGFESGFDRAPAPLVWLRNQWHEFRYGNGSIEQARINARFHYALGADFYGYWLDMPLMMYTCGYWKPGTRTVEEAQRNNWLLTGLLYVDTTKPNLMSLYNLVDTPLNRLTEADLRPERASIDKVNALMF